MTNVNLLQAMGRIDPKLIADAAPDVSQKKTISNVWLKLGAIAACFALVLAIGIPYFFDPGQPDVLPPLNVVEYNGAIYEVIDMADTKLLDTYNLPYKITDEMIGTEFGAGLDALGNKTEEIYYQYVPYAEIATEEANGDKRAQRAVYVVSKNGEYSFALFCNFIKYDANTHEEIAEMLAIYGIDAAEDIAKVEIGSSILDTTSAIEMFFDILCNSESMGNDDYQKTVYAGMTEAEQQALSKSLADSMIKIRIITNKGMVINNMHYYPTVDYVYWGITYYKMAESLR